MKSTQTDHLLTLMSMSPTMIYTCEPAGDFRATSISDNVYSQLGYTSAEYLSDPSFWADHLHPDDRDATFEGLNALFQNDEHEHDYRFMHADGTYRWMYDQARLLRDSDGKPREIVGYWHDVTERKQLAQDLEHSADSYRVLFNTVPYGIEEIDRDGTIVAANPAHHRTYGCDDGELVGRAAFEFCADDVDRQRLAQFLEDGRAAERPTPTLSHGTKLTDQGELREVEVAWDYKFNAAGELAGYISLITDVTERNKAEEARRKSQRRLELAVEGADEGLWDKDLQSGSEYWSPRFYDLLGYEVDEIEPTDEMFNELLHPDDRARVAHAVRNHLEGLAQNYNVEYRFRTKSGEYRWFRSRARALWQDGAPIRIVGFIADITAERGLQAALRETQQILDSTPDPTVIVNDLDDIVFVNSQVAAFGYEREELLGQPMATLLPGFQGAAHRPPSGDGLSGARARPGVELVGRRKDGSEFDVEVSLNPIDTDSGTLVAAAIRDISDRKLALERQRNFEAQIQQAQKLESLGILAGGIAHDFNNLLMGVLGNAEVGLIELPAGAPARQELNNIVESAMRAADLTKQMLAYSGRGKFVVEVLNLSELVSDIAQLLEVSISKNVVLRYDFADNLPSIEADPSQVQQVIMNLIINASEAIGDESGVVHLRTRVDDVDRAYMDGAYLDDDLPPGRYVVLEVSDTGCGMDEAAKQRIFDPFYTTKFAGRGLGLAAVLGIIRGHCGALKIDSEPGRGSTFTVLFPIVVAAVSANAASPAHGRQWRGVGTILVVDDEAPVRIAAGRMIESCGMSVLTAPDGRSALDIYSSKPDTIDAVLLDLTMPQMGGEETFRLLRRINPAVRVILTSGFNEQETATRFAGTGLAGFIQKPYGLHQLAERLRQALEPQPS